MRKSVRKASPMAFSVSAACVSSGTLFSVTGFRFIVQHCGYLEAIRMTWSRYSPSQYLALLARLRDRSIVSLE